MYGSDDNNGQQTEGGTPPPMIDAPSAPGSDMPGAPSAPADDLASLPANDSDASSNYIMTDPPAPADTSSDDTASHDQASASSPFSGDAPAVPAGGHTNDLLDLKQQALQQLAPLVDHLEQSPEDEFRTTMMMIQASDNKDLLQKAYDAAQKISDDKAKAQALLDIVNEINYFTQHHDQQ